jgi:hypothetical protein
MDAQDFRSLQEAYMEVVMGEGKVPWNDPKNPLESGHTPAEKNRAKRERTGVEDLKKSPSDKDYARYGDMKSVDDEQSSASNKNKSSHKFRDYPIKTSKGKPQTTGQLRRSRGTPKPGASDEKSNLYQSPIKKDDKRTRGGRMDQWKGPNPRNEEIDIYDIILSHLLGEGYADTQEAAEAIMVNMSEEWREDIVEISQKTATKAYATSYTGEFEGQDSPKNVKQTDNLRRQIKRKFGDKAAQHADRAGHAMTFGRKGAGGMPPKP